MTVIAKSWQNRIIGSGTEAPDQLLANPLNWRTHPEAQQKALSGVLDEVGWVQQIVVNQRTGNMIDGHLRVALALRRDEPVVPVLYVDLSAEEEALILATLDPIGALARADTGKLDELLRDVATGDAAVQAMLAELASHEGLYLDHEGNDRSGASPWDRMAGDAAEGVLFTFGSISCRLPAVVYERFERNCPESQVADYVAGVIDAACDN